jgi:hypothetical protein
MESSFFTLIVSLLDDIALRFEPESHNLAHRC